MSIITNFGCHGKCPYCIVRENGIDVPETTLEGLDSLLTRYVENDCNFISLSGGGDPLHEFRQHMDYYMKLFKLTRALDIPLEMHTSYLDAGFAFPVEEFSRVVYHLRDINKLNNVDKFGMEIVRVVFVVTEEMTVKDIDYIQMFVEESDKISELSFRQMVGPNFETQYWLHDYLKQGHEEGKWHYIEQNDYNLYYVNGQVYEKFSDIHK